MISLSWLQAWVSIVNRGLSTHEIIWSSNRLVGGGRISGIGIVSSRKRDPADSLYIWRLTVESGHHGLGIVVAVNVLANRRKLRVRVGIGIHHLHGPHLCFVVAPWLKKVFKITRKQEILQVVYSQIYFFFCLLETEHRLYYFFYWALQVVRISQVVEVRHRVNPVQEAWEPCHYALAFSELTKDVFDGLVAVVEDYIKLRTLICFDFWFMPFQVKEKTAEFISIEIESELLDLVEF